MKKWTVMLIPHDRGSTRTLTVCNWHFGVVLGLLVVLTFSTTFFFERHQKIVARTRALQEAKTELEQKLANKSVEAAPVEKESMGEGELNKMKAELQAKYQQSISALVAELGKVHELEAQVRNKFDVAPRPVAAEDVAVTKGNGRGGSASRLGAFSFAAESDLMRPPHVIYGMMAPSADLILQEMRVRTKSLDSLLKDQTAKEDVVERQPGTWPLVASAGRITSRFGYRLDPFNRRIRHHAGTDIAAPTGTKVQATGRGVIVASGYDRDYGNLIIIDHGNGLETWYAHLSARLVKKGDKVERNDLIGKVGSTGRSTGAHLHYEVHTKGKAVNAEKYLN
jgi:murein DD-endopeptidase MepM/ murein hydrolase activator NlpD